MIKHYSNPRTLDVKVRLLVSWGSKHTCCLWRAIESLQNTNHCMQWTFMEYISTTWCATSIRHNLSSSTFSVVEIILALYNTQLKLDVSYFVICINGNKKYFHRGVNIPLSNSEQCIVKVFVSLMIDVCVCDLNVSISRLENRHLLRKTIVFCNFSIL